MSRRRRKVSAAVLEFDPVLVRRLSEDAAKQFSEEPDGGRAVIRALRSAWQTALTPHQRTYMQEYYINRKTMQQIAAEYGVNKTTVWRTLRRARSRLRSVLHFYL